MASPGWHHRFLALLSPSSILFDEIRHSTLLFIHRVAGFERSPALLIVTMA